MSSSFVTSPWFRFGFPLLLLVAIWLGLSNVVLVIKSNLGMAVNLPYILFLIALTVAHIFKQSRIAMVAMTMLLAYWLIQIRLQTPLTVNSTMLELIMLSLLLPVACFYLTPTRMLDYSANPFSVTWLFYCCSSFGLG